VIEDDQSSPTSNQTAAQDLVQNKGVFGVIEDSSLAFGGAKYLNQQGVPVVGYPVDGPEWSEQPNTNMFAIAPPVDSTFGGKSYTYAINAQFLKDIGVTKLAQVTYNVASAIATTNENFYTAKKLGISNCYSNTSIPFGDVAFTAVALQIKAAGCNGVVGVSSLATDIALSSAVKQAGLHLKQLYYTAYDQSLLSQPAALAAMQGDYTTASINVTSPNAPTKLFLNRLKKYTAWPGGIPSLNLSAGYESADLMIYGLKLAGPNPTRKTFISKLRKVSSYTAGGLLTYTDVLSHFGTIGMLAKEDCEPIFQIEGKKFVAYNGGKDVCGKLIPASS